MRTSPRTGGSGAQRPASHRSGRLGLAAVALLLAGGAVGLRCAGAGWPPVGRLAATPRAVSPRGDLLEVERSRIELFRATSPSVVHIRTTAVGRTSIFSRTLAEVPLGEGSGFVWDERGYIVTNFHVIREARRAQVTLADGSDYWAEYRGGDPDHDLAVLKIDAPPESLRPLKIGTSHDLQVGQDVFSIGNPFGFDHTLTTGVVSSLGRVIQSQTRRKIFGVIQTDAAINPGNSGGPLLDSAGRLVGVTTSIYSPSGAYAGIGFAIPVDTVNRVVPQLIAHGAVAHAGLGVTLVDDYHARRAGLEGVAVNDVPSESAGAGAGMRGIWEDADGRWRWGDVIVAVEGQRVRDSDDLRDVLIDLEVGEEVAVWVQRGEERVKLDVVLQRLSE